MMSAYYIVIFFEIMLTCAWKSNYRLVGPNSHLLRSRYGPRHHNNPGGGIIILCIICSSCELRQS